MNQLEAAMLQQERQKMMNEEMQRQREEQARIMQAQQARVAQLSNQPYPQVNFQAQQPQQQQQSSSMPSGLSNLMQGSVAGGNGIGGGAAAPSFMGEGAGFSGAGSIGGYSTGGIMGAGAGGAGVSTAGASSPAFGAAGAASMGGGGAAAGGAGAGAGAGGGLAAAGPYAALVAAIAGGKLAQNEWGDSFGGRTMHGIFGPSISQMKADPKQIPLTMVSPILAAAFGSKKGIETEPEWKKGWDMVIGGGKGNNSGPSNIRYV